MKAKPEISVIMSSFNSMPFLRESVKSILNQTYGDFEFIVVDDASTDNSLPFLKSIRDIRLRLIVNKKNLGLALSLNKAIKYARGKYIARMDADDVSQKNRFKTQLRFLESNPEIDICGSFVSVIDENGKIIGHLKKPKKDEDIKKELYWLTPLIHPTWFARREVFEQNHGYTEKWDFAEDFDFLIRAKAFKMANIPLNLLMFRSQPNRRSQKDIEKIYKVGFKIRLHYYKKDRLGSGYLLYLLRSFISSYLFPTQFKIFLNKILKVA